MAHRFLFVAVAGLGLSACAAAESDVTTGASSAYSVNGSLNVSADNYTMFGFGTPKAVTTVLRLQGTRLEVPEDQQNMDHWARQNVVTADEVGSLEYLYIVAWSDLWDRHGLLFEYVPPGGKWASIVSGPLG